MKTYMDLYDVEVTEGQINQILFKMTPIEIRQRSHFDKAFQIRREIFGSFDELYKYREDIQELILLPVKEDSKRAFYNSLDKNELLKKLLMGMKNDLIMIALNEYPYEAPDDVEQYLVWVREAQTDDFIIASAIAKFIRQAGLESNHVILFERPIKTDTALVHGTFPLLRHIHLWIKRNDSSKI